MTAIQKVEHREVVPSTTPADLLRLAVEQGADLDRLEKLMDLQDRWEKKEAEKAFIAAMSAFKAEPVDIYKRKLVEFQSRNTGDWTRYMHAELSDITDAIDPVLGKYGLSYNWNVIQDGTKITVTCHLTHRQGHSQSVTMFGNPDNSGMKNQIQQVASTVTYLERYTLLAVIGKSTKGMDDDGRGSGDPEPPPQDQAGRPTDGVWEQAIVSGHTREEIEHIGINALEYWEAQDVAGAWEFLERQSLSAEAKSALWTLFDSKFRSALKKHKQQEQS
jgi:hypothetical protein